jgi:hypothetical protein
MPVLATSVRPGATLPCLISSSLDHAGITFPGRANSRICQQDFTSEQFDHVSTRSPDPEQHSFHSAALTAPAEKTYLSVHVVAFWAFPTHWLHCPLPSHICPAPAIRRPRVKAQGFAVSFRAIAALDQEQEPERACGEARG